MIKWGNAYVRKIVQNEDGTLLLDVELAVEDKVFKNTKKFGWLSKESTLTHINLVEYDHLITVKKVEEGVDFDSIVNHYNKFVTEALAEANIKNM